MKLVDHVLKEHRTIHVYKWKQRFVVRIVPKDHVVARQRGCQKAFYMDVWTNFWLTTSKRWRMGSEVHDLRREFDAFDQAICFLKCQGFTIKHPRKLPRFFG